MGGRDGCLVSDHTWHPSGPLIRAVIFISKDMPHKQKMTGKAMAKVMAKVHIGKMPMMGKKAKMGVMPKGRKSGHY